MILHCVYEVYCRKCDYRSQKELEAGVRKTLVGALVCFYCDSVMELSIEWGVKL